MAFPVAPDINDTHTIGDQVFVCVDIDPITWVRSPAEAQILPGDIIAEATTTSAMAAKVINQASTLGTRYPFRISELTTATFTVPVLPVRVYLSSLVMLGITNDADPFTTATIYWSDDNWATSTCLGTGPSHQQQDDLIGWCEVTTPIDVPLVGPSPGDSIQIAACLFRPDNTKTITPVGAATTSPSVYARVS
jgi:hypothetical protein